MASPGSPEYNPNADINDNCMIDIYDITIIAVIFGFEYYGYP